MRETGLFLCMAAAPMVCLAAGCQYDPHAHCYTTTRPQAADVVGRYKLTSQTVTTGGLSVLHGKPCDIELRADGTFTAVNLPTDTHGSPGTDCFSTLVTGSGNWRIDVVSHGASYETEHWGIEFESPAVKIHSTNLAGQKPPYELIFTLGDPDSGDAMIFEKAE
jgi:hypothetical protein